VVDTRFVANTHFTFIGQLGGVTRQCALCHELLVVNASSQELDSVDSHHLWSTAFQKHILERHSMAGRENIEPSATLRFTM
jgi:hypothetical protein